MPDILASSPANLRHVVCNAAHLCILISAMSLSGCGPAAVEQAAEPTPDSPALKTQPGGARSSPAPQAQTTAGAAAQEIEYGTLIDFTAGGSAELLKVSGWSKPETGFTWAEGNSATLAVRVRPTDSPITMRMKAAGLIKEPELPFQPVEVYVNNDKVADLQVGSTAEYNVAIPQGFTKAGGLLTVSFRIPKAASPKSLGQNEDERVLGIRIFNLEFGPSV